MPRTSLAAPTSPDNDDQIVEPFFAKVSRKSASRTLAILQAGRLHNSLSLASVGIIGLLASDTDPSSILIYLSAWIILFLGIYFVNDYYDASIDAINKPWKPVPSGRLKPGTLHSLGIAFLIIGVVSVILTLDFVNLSLGVGSIAAVTSAYLGLEYSRWIKRTSPLFGDVVISLTVSICFLLPWFSGGNTDTNYLFSLPIYTVALLGREYLKDLEDCKADATGGRMTFPRRYGESTTIRTAAILTLLSILWAIYLILLMPNQGGLRFIPFTVFSVLSVIYLYRNNVSKAQGWLKPALLFHLAADLIYWS